MINEFYGKEAATPEEARVLAMTYLQAISKVFVDTTVSIYELAKDNGFRGAENSNADNQMMTRKLIEQHKLEGLTIEIPDGPMYTLEAKRVHPICYNYRRDSSSSYTFSLSSFVTNIFEKQFVAKKFGVAAPADTSMKLLEMAETMRKYFILKPHYMWSVDSMCTELLDVYFLINTPSPLIAISDSSSARFATGDPTYVAGLKKGPDQRYTRKPSIPVSFYLDNELYHKMNLVDSSKIDQGMPVTGDQTQNIPMWNALRTLGQMWITDERMAEIKVLATTTLQDSALSKNFNKII